MIDGDNTAPVVSVVVLTFDRPRELRTCLASLTAQDFGSPFEIVVADDGSGAATTNVIETARVNDRRIRHARGAHRGIPATRNLGVAAARGAYVAIVADDYVLAPGYISRAVRYLDERPEAAVVRFDITPLRDTHGARISHCYYSASISRRLATESVSAAQLRAGCATTTLEAAGAAVFRREMLEAVGPWDESLQRGEDTEQTARLRALGFEVHVLGVDCVRHAYRRIPFDTVRKCFLTGIWRSRLEANGATATSDRPWVTRARRLRRVGGSWLAYDRARRGSTSWRGVVWYLPWMVLFESAAHAGALWAVISEGRQRAAGAPSGV